MCYPCVISPVSRAFWLPLARGGESRVGFSREDAKAIHKVDSMPCSPLWSACIFTSPIRNVDSLTELPP